MWLCARYGIRRMSIYAMIVEIEFNKYRLYMMEKILLLLFLH